MKQRGFALVALMIAVLAIMPRQSSAMGGQEGTFEFAIDAPWRMEPTIDESGQARYGRIPLVITVTDENVTPTDAYDRPIGKFCELRVTSSDGSLRRTFGFLDVAEIEATGSAATTIQTGSWVRGAPPPPHGLCRPGQQPCAAFSSPHGTSEWYATVWYDPTPADAFRPGANLFLGLTAVFTRRPSIACESARPADLLVMKNYVSIHAGEAPLPRFRDARWAYGDLHYHSQGTDNEGESGYGYRGTIRAMAAMGLDFVLASEHASDSDQIVDADINANLEGLSNPTHTWAPIQRDMSAARFAFLRDQLWAADGVNLRTALDGFPARPGGRSVAPQIFLGGEVDAIPELPANWPAHSDYPFGNGEKFNLAYLCGGWIKGEFAGISFLGDCPESGIVEQRNGATILKDVQGFNEQHPARAHMVYMPSRAGDADGFVSSRTGVYGGGGRQLTRGADGLFPEMENRTKGYAFLAHPVPMGGCDGRAPGLSGGAGPDVAPYTPAMLDQAFRSSAVLGLQIWNEDIRMKNAAGEGVVREFGFHTDDDDGYEGVRNSEPKGFVTGQFELYPWSRFPERSYAHACTGVEWMLHHGLRVWDELMIRGLFPHETAAVAWLPAGEPRRLFMAGGSDAHGDLNYHRAGYMRGLTQTDDMAIGKPRNLIRAGAPARVLRGSATANTPGSVRAFTQEQVLGGLRSGTFSVTDGPALRVAIDRNNNGVIDDADAQMGDVVEMYGDKTLSVLIEWDSTPEWGPVQQLEIVVGAVNAVVPYNGGIPGHRAIFAPVGAGPRSAGTPSPSPGAIRGAGDSRKIVYRNDGYAEDPTGGRMRVSPPWALSGRHRFELTLRDFSVGEMGRGEPIVPDRLYVRVFARSQPVVGTTSQCAVDPAVGRCIPRYAFSNPIWAISPGPGGACPRNRPRAIDSDGDGLPNGCDPCPHTRRLVCPAGPNGGPNGPPPVVVGWLDVTRPVPPGSSSPAAGGPAGRARR